MNEGLRTEVVLRLNQRCDRHATGPQALARRHCSAARLALPPEHVLSNDTGMDPSLDTQLLLSTVPSLHTRFGNALIDLAYCALTLPDTHICCSEGALLIRNALIGLPGVPAGQHRRTAALPRWC